ncbi:MAG: RNA polymerase factor sigma-54 [Planctomycetota bacterium]
MRLDTGQHMRLGQQMKLAPRMIQSMEVLQMPLAALEERIEQELAANPTLELVEAAPDLEEARVRTDQQARDDTDRERDLVVSNNTDTPNADDFERLANLADDYAEDWAANTTDSAAARNGSDFASETFASRANARFVGERDAKQDAMAQSAGRPECLTDQLLDQWRLADPPDDLAEAGRYLIAFIDADGYLRTPFRELVAEAPPGLTEDHLELALDELQQRLDPPGLAARDLRECLLLQIDHKIDTDRRTHNPDAPDLADARLIVDEHLADLEANRLPKIEKATGITIDGIRAAVRQLRQFHPHPGRLLVNDEAPSITPDAVIEYDEAADRYVATLTDGRTPNVQISPEYLEIAAKRDADRRTKDFLKQNITSARWLIDAIAQRHVTLLRVINAVLDAQRDYFDHGPSALKPLPMTQVADQLGIHVATVSRAVSEKYLQTPRGIVPLRMFFSGGTTSAAGDDMSWTAVQEKLKEVIAAEDKSKPLSDDALAAEMKKHGIDIARRTVAKYRGQLNIPSARQRKQY